MHVQIKIYGILCITLGIHSYLYSAGLIPAQLTAKRSFTSTGSDDSLSHEITEADLHQQNLPIKSVLSYVPEDSPRIDDTPGTTPPSPEEAEVARVALAIEQERGHLGNISLNRTAQLEKHEEREKLAHLATVSTKRRTLIEKIEEEGDSVTDAIMRKTSGEDFFGISPSESPASSNPPSSSSSTFSSVSSSPASRSPALPPIKSPASGAGSPSFKPASPSQRPALPPAPALPALSHAGSNPSPSRAPLWVRSPYREDRDKDKEKRRSSSLSIAARLSLAFGAGEKKAER